MNGETGSIFERLAASIDNAVLLNYTPGTPRMKESPYEEIAIIAAIMLLARVSPRCLLINEVLCD